MTDQHPITPPPELVQQWIAEIWHEGTPVQVAQSDLHLANRAAQWSADQKLEAIIAWMIKMGYWGEDGQAIPLLRAARRPKPPSLKEQALEALDDFSKMSETLYSSYDPPEEIYSDQVNIIRRALEALPDD